MTGEGGLRVGEEARRAREVKVHAGGPGLGVLGAMKSDAGD